ncbi:hypothetical protein [Streptomyces pseudovenezuelae]|uniref:hypothetical protein n=1 Tax=Streptomyces pseudovenezuelae TaxID=67350 RepID=UPI0036E236E5
MKLEGLAGIWIVVSFLLGQGVALGGVLITSRGQSKREQAARDAERERSLRDRREAFELEHLKDVHEALSSLLSVAELNIRLWCTWHRRNASRIHSLTPDEQAEHEQDMSAVEERAREVEREVNTHVEQLNKLGGLLLVDRLRLHVGTATRQYERLELMLGEDGPDDAEQALPEALRQLRAARSVVADRIREVYA